jgi:hypothetical protein
MRNYYNNYKKYKDIAIGANLEQFTYKNVGLQIKKVLGA